MMRSRLSGPGAPSSLDVSCVVVSMGGRIRLDIGVGHVGYIYGKMTEAHMRLKVLLDKRESVGQTDNTTQHTHS